MEHITETGVFKTCRPSVRQLKKLLGGRGTVTNMVWAGIRCVLIRGNLCAPETAAAIKAACGEAYSS